MSAANSPDAIAAVREMLPNWVVWGNDLLFVLAAVLIAFSGTWLATRIALAPLRPAAVESWQERARHAYVARWIVLLAGLIYPTAIITWTVLNEKNLSPLPRFWLGVATGIGLILIALAFHLQVERAIRTEPVSVFVILRSLAARVIIFMPHLLVALTIFGAMPDQFGWKSGLLLATTGVLSLALGAGGNLRIAQLIGLARSASPRLDAIVHRTSTRVGVKVRGVYEIDWAVANALAFPLSIAVAFTKDAFRILSDEELELVSAHELGHLTEPKSIQLVRLAVVVAIALYVPAIRPLSGSFGVAGLLLSLCPFLAAAWLFGLFSRRLERRADAVARSPKTDTPAYARALEKLYRSNRLHRQIYLDPAAGRLDSIRL
jgi:Zn-dependent protease with chaperone function